MLKKIVLLLILMEKHIDITIQKKLKPERKELRMKDEKLKSCAHCGGEARPSTLGGIIILHKPKCFFGEYNLFPNTEEFINKWNTRPVPSRCSLVPLGVFEENLMSCPQCNANLPQLKCPECHLTFKTSALPSVEEIEMVCRRSVMIVPKHWCRLAAENIHKLLTEGTSSKGGG